MFIIFPPPGKKLEMGEHGREGRKHWNALYQYTIWTWETLNLLVGIATQVE